MLGVDAIETMGRGISQAMATEASRQAMANYGVPRGLSRWQALHPALKRSMDVAGAATLLLLALPLFAVVALVVRADGGPAFYAHERVGRGGRRFGCLKFRSMVVDSAERLARLLETDPAARAEWEATRKLKKDPRVTWIGRLLRASSLDELPQLINVLRGEMSLVGPRPVIQAELNAHYGAAAEHYLSVRPGITGLWQISGRNDTTYAERVALDVRYAVNPSLLADVKILLRTPMAVIARRGAY
ncbi:sugar transferase [Siccirubricoccus sp. KC 17139]|uniref:Sugar transferase n=1 Tax=Siccirubricoccus soli TaxID=2899147 RepID=A0ABT1D7E5_9PROT|nr:sugar transferase [Siccirubricoccus soli]MCO6417848.1 sugar transferase [Siccirubricoccus soli]MCP2683983.1 sugar transferase [Siccirubricoccus soli]